MKKSVTVLALALSLSIPTLNASNPEILSTPISVVEDNTNVSALCTAVAKGEIEKVKQLLNNGVDVNKKSNGMQPIHYAARHNRVDIIKVLITAGSDIHTPCDKGYSAISHAQKTNAVEAAEFLKRFKRFKR
ncbi:ankyrin repeat domain-containing protein [uncultured Winogradskyella sp.]|jgi:ankyrin repeat protein|uniref:ankyrin repeat domain-containing protein n=1 Tax=uncultured Winogradskyella sp. TaxID=395353 RepID=UPI0025FC658E|nr:ankyrin repeat domain-containing protein [uncultured Winogradskyella sp.]